MELLKILPNGQWTLRKAKVPHAMKEWILGDVTSRDAIPKMEGDMRGEAVKDLHSKAKSRINPKTNEAEFLLHRGIGEQEDWAHGDKGVQNLTSWTPHYDVAHKFSSHYNKTAPDKVYGSIKSAWIPESQIHSIPSQYGAYDTKGNKGVTPIDLSTFKNEHEVIVAPHKFSHVDADVGKALMQEHQEKLKAAPPKKKLAAKDFY